MTQQRESGLASYTAGEALAAFRQVKLDGTNDRQVVYADAGESGIGITQALAASGDQVTVKEWSAGGTFKVMVSEAIATRNCWLYSAADGKLADTASGDKIARSLDVGTAALDIIEVLPAAASAKIEAGGVFVAAIDDDSGGTTGGTEQINPIVTATIDDDSGGTTGGTEQLADVLAAQTGAALTKETTLAGTDGGTPALVIINGVGGTDTQTAQIRNNLRVIAKLADQNQADIASIVTNANNNAKVISTQLNLIETNGNNNNAVIAAELNAIRTSLINAGLMAAS